MVYTPPEVLIDLVKYYEGLSLSAYRDPVGYWTIGYGHLVTKNLHAPKPPNLTQEKALALLVSDIRQVANRVAGLNLPVLEAHRFAVLVDFAFNLGIGNLRASTLLRKVKEKAPEEEIIFQLGRWNKAGGRVLRGLTLRRGAEAMLWITGGFDPAQVPDYCELFKS